MPVRGGQAAVLRRASGLAVGMLASLLASGVLLTPLATATALPPSTDPLPGSLFQGADGDQSDALPRIDWQALQAGERVRHEPDANAEDTAFDGGSKENLPGEWELGTQNGGVSPGKSNILDLWAASEPRGPDAFLYLAFARFGVEGTTYAAFELNHDARLWDNGQADIPCRRTGDVLVSYVAAGGDPVDVVIQRWVTTATHPLSGCAREGRLTPYTVTPNVDAQGAVNEATTPITTYLPGFFDGTIAFRHFGEASLNVGRTLGQGPANSCVDFSSIWMHSRASDAEEANLEDYVEPHALTVRTCSASGTKFHDVNANGRRDPGEPGLPRWMIWADYDDDGARQANEPFAITDSEGQYVINDIRPPDGTYTLRETLPTPSARRRARAANVTCSFPSDGTPGGGTGSAPGGLFPCGWVVNAANMTYARGRDFGNYIATVPPPPPPPPPPPAPPPSPIIPPGPRPPDANDPGRAGIRLPARLCVGQRIPRIAFRGTRVAAVQVFVNGRLRRRLAMGVLQQRSRPRVRLTPGRHRLRVRVTFQRGSGSPAVDLTQVITISLCPRVAAAPPSFTG